MKGTQLLALDGPLLCCQPPHISKSALFCQFHPSHSFVKELLLVTGQISLVMLMEFLPVISDLFFNVKEMTIALKHNNTHSK